LKIWKISSVDILLLPFSYVLGLKFSNFLKFSFSSKCVGKKYKKVYSGVVSAKKRKAIRNFIKRGAKRWICYSFLFF